MSDLDPIRIRIGDRIRAGRLARGWTLNDLGLALGVSRQRVHDVESGRVRSEPGWRVRCARALGVPVRDLVPELAEWIDAGEPGKQLDLVQDGFGHGDEPGRWKPLAAPDEQLATEIGADRPLSIGELLRRCAAARVAVRFRGDLASEGGTDG
jgi:transcriptional regulator with XRE-family HTH domain